VSNLKLNLPPSVDAALIAATDAYWRTGQFETIEHAKQAAAQALVRRTLFQAGLHEFINNALNEGDYRSSITIILGACGGIEWPSEQLGVLLPSLEQRDS
jgi:hypothetical protein